MSSSFLTETPTDLYFSNDFVASNAENVVSHFNEHEKQWREFFHNKSKLYRLNAQQNAEENTKNKRVAMQIQLVKWAYIKEQKEFQVKEIHKRL